MTQRETFEELWGQLVAKQPDMLAAGAKIEITTGRLERLLRQFYDKGVVAGTPVTKEEREQLQRFKQGPLGDFFKDFGGPRG